MVSESEGPTLVVPVDDARRAGPPVDLELAWLTLTVWSSLEAVGLTAAFSRQLTAHGISANVVAGYFHDHIFVPVELAEQALTAIHELTG